MRMLSLLIPLVPKLIFEVVLRLVALREDLVEQSLQPRVEIHLEAAAVLADLVQATHLALEVVKMVATMALGGA